MKKRDFILENIDVLSELRDADEVKLYFKANNFNIKDKEIESIKASVGMMLNRVSDSQLLDIEDLTRVSGGMSETGAALIAIGIGIFTAALAIAIPAGVAALRAPAINTAEGIAVDGLQAAKSAAKANFITGIMLGSAVMETAEQGLMAYPQRDEAMAYQSKYAHEMTERTLDYNTNG